MDYHNTSLSSFESQQDEEYMIELLTERLMETNEFNPNTVENMSTALVETDDVRVEKIEHMASVGDFISMVELMYEISSAFWETRAEAEATRVIQKRRGD